jgi:hypothetical protein
MAFYPPQASCQELILITNVQLDYPYSANTSNLTVTDMIDVSATIPNLNIFLPNSTLTGPGFSVTFNNVGTNSFNVVLNDRITVLTAIAQGEVLTVYLYSNPNANGNWRVIPFGSGVNAISTLDLASSDDSVIVTNGEVSPPGGKINIGLPTIISKTQTLTSTGSGIVTMNPSSTSPWGVTTLNNGSNITITNPDASTGSPTISLNDTVSIAQLVAGNIVIDNNLITNTDTAGGLHIVSNGTNSFLNLNSILINPNGDVSSINNLTVDGTFKSDNTAKSWCRFTNTSGVIAVVSNYNVSGVTYNTTTKQYTMTFSVPMTNTNYCVFINCANNNSTPPLQTRIGYDVLKQLGSVSIVLTDASGEILQDIPEGVSVIIFSLN